MGTVYRGITERKKKEVEVEEGEKKKKSQPASTKIHYRPGTAKGLSIRPLCGTRTSTPTITRQLAPDQVRVPPRVCTVHPIPSHPILSYPILSHAIPWTAPRQGRLHSVFARLRVVKCNMMAADDVKASRNAFDYC